MSYIEPSHTNEILIVEDNADLANIYQNYLRNSGYDILHWYEYVAAALNCIQDRNGNIVVTVVDLYLPSTIGGANNKDAGIEFVSTIRKICDYPIAVIICSAFVTPNLTSLFTDTDDLKKPFLHACIDKSQLVLRKSSFEDVVKAGATECLARRNLHS